MLTLANEQEQNQMPRHTDATEIVAKNVQALLIENDWTQKDLQRKSGVAQKTISNIVRTGSTTTGRIDAIARSVGLPGWTLLLEPYPGIRVLRELAAIASLFLSCDQEGKAQIKRVAEAEARYSETQNRPD